MTEQKKRVVYAVLFGLLWAEAGYIVGIIHQQSDSHNQYKQGLRDAQSEIDSAIWELRVNDDVDGSRDIRIDTLQTFQDRFKGNIHNYKSFINQCVVIQSATDSKGSNIVQCGGLR